MARSKRDAKIDSRSARARLTARREPYWTALAKGAYLGYRRSDQRGSWIARYRSRDGKQNYKPLGAADDLVEADGAHVLNYTQAQQLAQDFFADQVTQLSGFSARHKYTVADAMTDYLRSYSSRGGRALDRILSVVTNYILPEFGGKLVQDLTRQEIEIWRTNLVESAPRGRPGQDRKSQFKVNDANTDRLRRRRASANRILTVLKAALNHAYQIGAVKSDTAWAKVKPYRGVDAARVYYLKDDELVRLTNNCEPDFRPLVMAAVLTGCRYGELISIRVADFDHDSGTILISTSKSGKPRRVYLNDEGRDFFFRHTAGRNRDLPIFAKADGEPWKSSDQVRRFNAATARANIKDCTFHGLRHTYASRTIMNGAALPVVAAQLGHSDTRMVEKHYGHLAPNYIADAFRTAYKSFGFDERVKLVSFKNKDFAA